MKDWICNACNDIRNQQLAEAKENLQEQVVLHMAETSNSVNGYILYMDGDILANIGKQP